MYNIEEIILGMANIVNEKKKLEETVSELQNRIYELECQIKNLSNSKYIGPSQSEVTMSMYKKDKTENGYLFENELVNIDNINEILKQKLNGIKKLNLIVKEFDVNILMVTNYCYKNDIELLRPMHPTVFVRTYLLINCIKFLGPCFMAYHLSTNASNIP